MATKKSSEKKKNKPAVKKTAKSAASKTKIKSTKKKTKTASKKAKTAPKKAKAAPKKSKPASKKPATKKKAVKNPPASPEKTAIKTSKKTGSKKVSATKKELKLARADKEKPIPIADVDLSLDSKVQRQHDVAWRMIDGEAVIITPADSTMHTLNDVGTRIWELIGRSSSLRQVAELLCAEFDVGRDRAEKDTLWFAECLAKKGLLEQA